ncbi:MAG: hypothetical protein Q8M40_11955 [Legionella sp.]|nr:hypothetical protein [Legionella sp.]
MSVVLDLRKFLIEYSGAAGRIIQNQSKRDKKESVFFAPMKSKTDLLIKPAYIATAPVCMVFISIELITLSALTLISVIVESPIQETKTSQKNLEMVGKTLFLGLLSLVVAVFSPILNLVDCISSLFAEVKPNYGLDSSLNYY